jgi:branched-chain amino acid transport system permease protein
MADAPQAAGSSAPLDLRRLVLGAALVGIVAFGLFGPLLGLKTEQNMDNQVILRVRPWLPFIAVAVSVAVYVAVQLFRAAAASRPAKAPAATRATGLRKAVTPLGLVFVFAYPLLVVLLAGTGGIPKWVDNFGILILIYVMLGWGLNIVVGLAGLLDLGYVAFYAIGSYSYALLALHFGWSFWLCLPVAGILAAFWGILLGFPVLRLRGDYLAIVTLAFGEIIYLVAKNWKDFTGGGAGISAPRITFFGIKFDGSPDGFAAWLSWALSSITTTFGFDPVVIGPAPWYRTIFLYYVIVALALVTALVTLRLRRLPVGRAWEALREDEIACRSLGINTTSTKLTAFACGAFFGGLAGAFFGARQGFVDPEGFRFIESAIILAIVVLGGMGSLIGVALAAVAMQGGTEILRELNFLKHVFGDDFKPELYRMLIFGGAMVIIMLWKPRGFVSVRQPTAFLVERKAIGVENVKEGHG